MLSPPGGDDRGNAAKSHELHGCGPGQPGERRVESCPVHAKLSTRPPQSAQAKAGCARTGSNIGRHDTFGMTIGMLFMNIAFRSIVGRIAAPPVQP